MTAVGTLNWRRCAFIQIAPHTSSLQGEHDKAATLYMKGGKLSKAVEMCFAAKLFDVLQMIADDLEANQDPGLYTRCAEFFLQVWGDGGVGNGSLTV